jgi:hypothetical protein
MSASDLAWHLTMGEQEVEFNDQINKEYGVDGNI